MSIKSNENSIGHGTELNESESTAEFIRNLSKTSKSDQPIKSKQKVKSTDSVSSDSAKIGCFGLKSKSKNKVDPVEEETDLKKLEPNDESEEKSDDLTECDLNDERRNWWKEPVTKYAFNLPTVRTNLKRLIGTDEVILSDHQFMMNLRTSVWNDYDEELTDRIKQREAMEDERSKQLILKSKFNLYNCPKKMRPLHSDVLAFDLQTDPMQLEKPLQADRLSQYDATVFNINKKTNMTVHLRRKKLKSIRKANFEHLMRQVVTDFRLSCD